MERPFEEVAFRGLGHRSVTVQVAVPLTELVVGEVGVCPVADLLVAFQVFLVSCQLVGIQVGDDGFGLRLPELHVL